MYRRVDRTGNYLATEQGEGSTWKGWMGVTLASHEIIYKEKLKNDFSCGRMNKKPHGSLQDTRIQNGDRKCEFHNRGCELPGILTYSCKRFTGAVYSWNGKS